jgi:hypothetical protein
MRHLQRRRHDACHAKGHTDLSGSRTICKDDAAIQKQEEDYEPVSVHASAKDIQRSEDAL